ncbi:MAG: hypothetical protein KatS3mg108_2034 [Isosphaeraceae bacterium]|nr:MAG: hypothetical protein KatS3mg108_2034 [Isosphaeraceae bacterium]
MTSHQKGEEPGAGTHWRRRRSRRPGCEPLESRRLLTALPLLFDFNSTTSPSADGYIRVVPGSYNPRVGYGWKKAVSAIDRSMSDDLKRDFHMAAAAGFAVDLPVGQYQVKVVLGDARAQRDLVSVFVEGRVAATNLSTAAGQFAVVETVAAVSDGQLNVRLVDNGGKSGKFAINALEVWPLTTVTANAGEDQTGVEGSAIQFRGSGTGFGELSYSWDFGDGTTQTGTATPTHTYADNGVYTVTLTVRDARGVRAIDTARVTVQNAAPVVTLRGPNSGTSGESLAFTANATDPGPVDQAAGFSYSWNFGDGTTASGASVTKAFAAGTYTVIVTARDKDGATATETLTVQVSDPEVVPPLPELSTWKSNMLSYGKKHADWLAAHRNDAKLDPVLAATYYDAARVFYQIADETGDPAWRTAAADAVFVYRDRYVLPNNGAVPGYWNFGKGLAEHFRRTGDVRSRDALFALADNAAYSRESTAPDVLTPVERSREVAYALMTRLEAEALGKPHSARTDLLYEKALGHVDQWVNNPTIYLQPFMVGLTCEALIAYHAATGDARALPAVQRALDMIWDRAWREAGGGFYYESTAPDRAAPDLNMLIAPAFGWVYRQTRQTLYRDRGDQVFAGGVRGAWLDGAKQFNQNYRWSFAYVAWRNG